MTEEDESAQVGTGTETEKPAESEQPPSGADGRPPESEEDGPDPGDVVYEPVRSVTERNAFTGNTIIVKRDFVGSIDGHSAKAVTMADVTAAAHDLERSFVEPPSFAATVKLVKEQRLGLLVGGGCGNRVAATMALHRAGHRPILEVPGALPAPDLVAAVDRACEAKSAGILIDSVDAETLTALAGVQLRQLRGLLPPRCAVVFTTRAEQSSGGSDELPTVLGTPPDAQRMVDSLAERRGLEQEARQRCAAALELLPQPVSPAMAVQLVDHAATADAAEELAGTVAGQSPALREWLAGCPEAKSLATLAAAAALHKVPRTDFDDATPELTALLEGEVDAPTEPPRFGPPEHLWPAGVVRCREDQVMTYFGWQEAEVVEIRPPHEFHGVVAYLWRNLGGEFRRPFLEWLRRLADSANNQLVHAAARTAGVLFACDPRTIERELLRPWALDGRAAPRAATGFALGMPVVIGADPSAGRRLLKQWAKGNSPALRAAAIVAYGGPLGIWDPSAAAVSHLWEAGPARPDLLDLANRSLAAHFVGGGPAGRARATVVGLLAERAESRAEASRVYAILPLALRELTGGGAMARRSLEALLEDSESATLKVLADLLAKAFDSREGRGSAREAMRIVLRATAAGRIGRDVVERLIREMKAGAAERGRLPQLGSQLEQLLKAEDRNGGPSQDVARSLHETFYEQGQGGRSLEIE